MPDSVPHIDATVPASARAGAHIEQADARAALSVAPASTTSLTSDVPEVSAVVLAVPPTAYELFSRPLYDGAMKNIAGYLDSSNLFSFLNAIQKLRFSELLYATFFLGATIRIPVDEPAASVRRMLALPPFLKFQKLGQLDVLKEFNDLRILEVRSERAVPRAELEMFMKLLDTFGNLTTFTINVPNTQHS
jgi:hypothetical protein